MYTHKKLKRVLSVAGLVALFISHLALLSMPVYADPRTAAETNSSSTSNGSGSSSQSSSQNSNAAGGSTTTTEPKEPDAGGCVVLPNEWCDKDGGDAKKGGSVVVVIKWILRILTGGVGIVAVGAFVWAGILYSSAADNSEQIQRAKDVMKQVTLGLFLYGFMALIINFLVPGGIFG